MYRFPLSSMIHWPTIHYGLMKKSLLIEMTSIPTKQMRTRLTQRKKSC